MKEKTPKEVNPIKVDRDVAIKVIQKSLKDWDNGVYPDKGLPQAIFDALISSGHIQKKTETRIFTNFDIPDVSLNNSIFSKTVIIDNGEGFVTIGWFDFIISEWSYESDFKLPEKFYWYYPTNIKNFKK